MVPLRPTLAAEGLRAPPLRPCPRRSPSRSRPRSRSPKTTLTPLLLLILLALPARALDTNGIIRAWLQTQTNLQTWSAELTQTRTLKALAEPLVTPGRVWFAAPDKFRWELGDPAQSIAVRDGQELFMVSPRLKRAERYPLDGAVTGPWRDALSLLESGFPRDAAAFAAQYRLRSLSQTNSVYELRLQPASPGARRMIPEVMLVLATNGLGLVANELTMADGSVLRNDFREMRLNPALGPEVFRAPVTPDFKITEPWKNQR